MGTREKKPSVTIVDGNAFAIMAACRRAARRAGWTTLEIDEVLAEMKAWDYDHLLRVVMLKFDVR